jgi:hypothetical protein
LNGSSTAGSHEQRCMRPGELPAESNLKLSRLSVRPDERPLRPVELGLIERIGYERAPWAPAATAARILIERTAAVHAAVWLAIQSIPLQAYSARCDRCSY